MRKCLSLIVCVLLMLSAAIFLCSCSDGGDTSSTEDGVLSPVKDDAGQIIAYQRIYHNDHGDITRLDKYDADQEYTSFVIYEYDDSYRLIKETTYRADGIGDFYYTYDYYDNGNIREKGYFTATNGAERTVYDEDGIITDVYAYDMTDTLVRHQSMVNGAMVDVPIDETEESPASDADSSDAAEQN